MNKKLIGLLTVAGLTLFAGQAFADRLDGGTVDDVADADVRCGISEMRTATMDYALDCDDGAGNPKEDDLQSYWAGAEWVDEGHIEGGSADGFLEWSFISGMWGSGSFSGEWTIADAFWETYAEAVISFHVGNGNGDPDHFAFLIEPGDTTGILSYLLETKGGGFSNLVVWGRGEGASVPEPGTMALLGMGLMLLGFRKRRKLHHV